MSIREDLKKFEDIHPQYVNIARGAINKIDALEIEIMRLNGLLPQDKEKTIQEFAGVDIATPNNEKSYRWTPNPVITRKHAHYFKPCPHKEIDVYRVLEMFNVTNAAIAHATKKLLVAGGRGAGKDITQDIQEAIDTLERWKEMQQENKQVNAVS